MKKKIIIIVSIVLVATFATCIFAASSSKDDLKPLPVLSENEVGLFEINANAVSSRKFITNDNTEISLSYAKSMITQGDSLDMYLNENNDEYYFDKSGNIVGFMGNDTNLPSGFYDSKATYIDENTAIKIAEEQAQQIYGEISNDFEYDHHYLSSCGNIYYIFHSIRYGEDGFILGPACWSQVTNEGNVLVIMLKRYYETKDFDKSLLDGITKADLKNFVKEQVQHSYGDSYEGYTIDSYTLVNDDNTYKIKITATIKVPNERPSGKAKQINTEFYYEIK